MKFLIAALALAVCAVHGHDKYDIIIRRAEQCREHPDLPVVLRDFKYAPPLSTPSTSRKFSASYSVKQGIQENQPIYFQKETWSCEEAEKEPDSKVQKRHGHHCSTHVKESIIPLKCGESSLEGSPETLLRKALDPKNPCFSHLGEYVLSDLLITPESVKAQDQQYDHLEVNYILYSSDAQLYFCLHVHADRVLKQ